MRFLWSFLIGYWGATLTFNTIELIIPTLFDLVQLLKFDNLQINLQNEWIKANLKAIKTIHAFSVLDSTLFIDPARFAIMPFQIFTYTDYENFKIRGSWYLHFYVDLKTLFLAYGLLWYTWYEYLLWILNSIFNINITISQIPIIFDLFFFWGHIICLAILTIWARGVGPRFRPDQLSNLTWKDLIVFIAGLLFVISIIVTIL